MCYCDIKDVIQEFTSAMADPAPEEVSYGEWEWDVDDDDERADDEAQDDDDEDEADDEENESSPLSIFLSSSGDLQDSNPADGYNVDAIVDQLTKEEAYMAGFNRGHAAGIEHGYRYYAGDGVVRGLDDGTDDCMYGRNDVADFILYLVKDDAYLRGCRHGCVYHDRTNVDGDANMTDMIDRFLNGRSLTDDDDIVSLDKKTMYLVGHFRGSSIGRYYGYGYCHGLAQTERLHIKLGGGVRW